MRSDDHTASAPARRHSPQPRAIDPLDGAVLQRAALTPAQLTQVRAEQLRHDTPLRHILLRQGLIGEAAYTEAIAAHFGTRPVDLATLEPDPILIDRLGPQICLQDGLLPLRRMGGATMIATAHPGRFENHRARLTALFGPVAMAVIAPSALEAGVLRARGRAIAHHAETRVPAAASCRRWNARAAGWIAAGVATVGAMLIAVTPTTLMLMLVAWTALTLLLLVGLRMAAAIAWLTSPRGTGETPDVTVARLPTVSILVPLCREPDIAPRLVERLSRLRYPRALLDVILVIEADDHATRDALARADLPGWMRVVSVPEGSIRTKPRALNHAMLFARGGIVGIYDAEDAPDPDQIHTVVRHFHARGPELGCVQGILDFYNPATNWIARCFTIEYAAWFRILLRGIQRLGLALPLGGTTLFVRRDVIEEVGGWDAHNVTEDADLGIRLARFGYRTEVISTTTQEEPNCRPVAWIKQRSRWLKGFMVTYIVHMRTPRATLRALGAWRVLGLQVVFLATVSQYLLAPLLWSFWLVALGLWHPLGDVVSTELMLGLAAMFVVSELVNLTIAFLGVSGEKHRFLRKWVPMLHLYFPLGAIAAYKALWELLTKPFYWDKTVHGLHDAGR